VEVYPKEVIVQRCPDNVLVLMKKPNSTSNVLLLCTLLSPVIAEHILLLSGILSNRWPRGGGRKTNVDLAMNVQRGSVL
jgi:hypothetical protein